MPIQPITSPDLPAAPAPAAPAVRAGGAVYVSGTAARAPDGRLLHPGNVRLQAARALDGVARVLEAAGAGLADIAMAHVTLRYRGDLAAFNETWAERFGDAAPARHLVIGEPAEPDCLVEIACVAHPG